MAASRMALARALIEYDNDSDDEDTRKDWRQSAIFIPYHIAQQEARRQQILSQPAPVLPSPLEATFPGDKTPTAPAHRAPLPLPAPQQVGDGEDIADVRDWGIPSHLVSAKAGLPPRQRVVSRPVPHPVPPHTRAQSQHASEHFHDDPQRTTHGDRRVSLDQYSSTGQNLERRERSRTLVGRPHSAMGLQNTMRPEVRDRRISNPVMIPLPSSPSPTTTLLPLPSLSLGFDTGLGDEEEVIDDGRPNPFAVAAPRPEMGSRFDPKVLQEQRRSIDSTRSIVAPRPPSLALTLDGNQPQSSDYPRQSSDLSSRRSTDLPHLSRPSLDSYHSSPILDFPRGEEYDEIPTPQAFGRSLMPLRYAPSAVKRMNRNSLRPTILVMPSPLADAPSAGYEQKTRDGFVLGEKPLPADAKTQGRRPGIPLSLSQRTFRSSLMIDGRREDPEWIGGAEKDGEIGVERRDTSEAFLEKKAGKLYGQSLMDELEARKSNMKGRSRTFMGDSRPAMMSRSSMHIDSASLSPTSPLSATSKRPGSFHPGGRQPLLRINSNEEDIYALEAPGMNSRENKSQSVFGVDHIWEREMVKLRQLQEQEARLQKANQEERRRKEEEEEGKKKKRKSRAKSKLSEEWSREDWEKVDDPAKQEPIVESLQETASFRESIKERDDNYYIAEGSVAGSPTPEEPVVEEDSDSDDSEANVPLSKLANKSASLRSPSVQNASGSASIIQSSASALVVEDDDSDEDVPLSRLARKSPSVSSSSQPRPPTTSEPLRLSLGSPTPSKSYSEEYGAEEDDLPLAIRQAQSKGLKPPTRAEVVEDDLPLGYKHADVVQRQMQKRNVNGVSAMSGMSGQGSMFGAPQMGMGSPYNSVWGMPQMPMGQMPMGMPYGQPMGYGMGIGMPSMGMMGQMGQMSVPNLAGPGMMAGDGNEGPAANIDSWRHEVPLGVGSARSGEGSV
ncbi:hypothetical protein L198_07064 [Cryptococcus wingfieldii CBS 7118]|uniref:Uncharacterized protein n=1 Tax=Cryptococcus wingfieldii CBS 7118 TaxID=1295528 RepID=A0A1E3IFR6_9TREE|nr:hypothetical protein L198_07064 [Cryptococcus wingfieldii CBS 7118]ODN87437.1 hypothetical protein L198_07064 [Cryptococcus wingfieldii CBS 7118]